MALAGPDQALMGPGEHLDGLGQVAVAGYLSVMVAVGACQLGQRRCVTGVGLGPRGRMTFPVAGHRHRVQRVDLVSRRDQRTDEQAAVGLSGHHHFGGIVDMLSHQGVKPGDALQPFW